MATFNNKPKHKQKACMHMEPHASQVVKQCSVSDTASSGVDKTPLGATAHCCVEQSCSFVSLLLKTEPAPARPQARNQHTDIGGH